MAYISSVDETREYLEEFTNALYNAGLDLEVYENSVGSRERIIDTSTGWDINKDDELFGWIEYNMAESKKEDIFGERGSQEVYVPGIVRSDNPGENYFMPVVWTEERDDIKERVKEQTGISRVTWRTKGKYYAGDERGPGEDPKNKAFDIALLENDIELETDFDETTGVETWPETDVVQLGMGEDKRIYGYVKEHTRNPDMDKEPIEVEAEIVGRLEPYGELEEPLDENWYDIADKIARKDEDIESIRQVNFDGSYLPE